ncbi:F-box/kelch-repeat protein At3g23880-like [Vicia villosa]|uniref:F-box/kelch-repeat protein At3g23880-like n=1 Tax=Vicia villosa TaxID=3911 RepID=UPI00273CE2B3|nr:F-box/kelch-repeat protein At3g23880-like [Vicia villosa]
MELPCYHYAIGSCNGLTCFINYVENKFYLWNPSTTPSSQNLTSFSFPFEHGELVFRFRFSFVYDNFTNKYKLVAFLYKKVRIFTFGDNVWKNIESFSVYPYHSNDNEGVYLNNSLNWFVFLNYKPFYNKEDLKVEQLMIISLDLATETYTQFQLPREFDEFPSLEPILCKLMDSLCLSHYTKKHSFVIWQMTEFGVEKSWTKFLKFDYHSLLGCSIFVVSLLPLHMFENGDVLIWERNVGQLIRYNRRDNRVVKKTTYTNNNIYLSYAVLYVESLVSNF